jgi:hypothetical protein
MKRFTFMLLVLTAALSAQSTDKLQDELRRTDDIIARAAPVIERSGNERAIALLGEARQLQSQAWAAYHNRQPRRAGTLTLSARQKVKDALLLIDISPDRVREEVRRTSDLMNEAAPLVKRSTNPRVQELWRMVQSEQAQAKTELEAGHYRLALKYTFTARNHLKEAIDIIRRSITPEQFEAAIQRTDALLERTSAPVKASGNERAIQTLQNAADMQEQARAAWRSRQVLQAFRLARSARDLAWRAWELAVGQADPAMVQQALTETDGLLSEWSGAVADARSTEASGLLAQATTLQQSAQEHFAAGRLKPAFVATTRARRLVQRAIDLVHSGEPSTQE